MTELETQIWNTVHNWCDAQTNEIPDQNRRYLMDEIKALVLSHVSGSLPPIDPLDDENSEIYKIGREIAEMSDEEFEANCKAFEGLINKSKGTDRQRT